MFICADHIFCVQFVYWSTPNCAAEILIPSSSSLLPRTFLSHSSLLPSPLFPFLLQWHIFGVDPFTQIETFRKLACSLTPTKLSISETVSYMYSTYACQLNVFVYGPHGTTTPSWLAPHLVSISMDQTLSCEEMRLLPTWKVLRPCMGKSGMRGLGMTMPQKLHTWVVLWKNY